MHNLFLAKSDAVNANDLGFWMTAFRVVWDV